MFPDQYLRARTTKKSQEILEEMQKRRYEDSIVQRKNKRKEIRSKRSSKQINFAKLIKLNSLAITAADASNPDGQLAALQMTRNVLSNYGDVLKPITCIEEFLNSNMLPVVVNCLRNGNHVMVQLEAAWAITNIAACTVDQTIELVKSGVIPLLIDLISSNVPEICIQAVWALGNIICNGNMFRDIVIDLGIVIPLLGLISCDTPTPILDIIAWVIVNLCTNKDPNPMAINQGLPIHVIEEMLPAIHLLIYNDNINIVVNSLLSVIRLTEGDNQQIQIVIDSGILTKLITLIGDTRIEVKRAALCAVGNILSGSDDQTEVVLNHDVLAYIPPLLNDRNSNMLKDTVWFISNITAGNEYHIEAVIDAGLLPKIVEFLQHDEIMVKKEAAIAISNLTFNGNNRQIYEVLNLGAIQPFCDLLTSRDNVLLCAILKGIQNIFDMAGDGYQSDNYQNISNMIENCNGYEKINMLQYHENTQIYLLAFNIIDKYFVEEPIRILNENIKPTAITGKKFQLNPNCPEFRYKKNFKNK